MNFWGAYLVSSSVVFSMMTALWACSLLIKDASIVDRVWGLGFVLIAWTLACMTPMLDLGRLLMVIMVSIWGLRLSFYIHFRNQGHPEDYRYAAMRKFHGKRFWWYSFFSVFTLQAVIMLVVAMPVIWTLSRTNETAPPNFVIAATLIWFIGFIFEAGGDWQLKRFKSDASNRGKLLNTGFWRWTRHPNYFGDALQWWAFGALATAYGSKALPTLIGPAVMTLFLRKVSGVDLLEKTMRNSKPGYEDYVKTVPAFLPKWQFWAALAIASALVMVLI